MFYPDIVRRVPYSTKDDGEYYASYSHYRDEITEDCDRRCVYCDITLTEQGGEGMQLDHFKPQNHFKGLVNDPNNLVLACQKCNRLKSDHWPIKEEIGLNGFLDPFTNGRNKWYKINPCGTIEHLESPAAGLMIEILSLNRPARVQVRRRRVLEKRASYIDNYLNKKLKDLREIVGNDKFDNESKVTILVDIIHLKEKIDELRKL